MHSFVSEGGDGFTSFEQCEVDESYLAKKNIVLIHELMHLDEHLLAGYAEKYPGRISYR